MLSCHRGFKVIVVRSDVEGVWVVWMGQLLHTGVAQEAQQADVLGQIGEGGEGDGDELLGPPGGGGESMPLELPDVPPHTLGRNARLGGDLLGAAPVGEALDQLGG